MARYKFRPCPIGGHLNDESGRPCFRADTYQDALEMFVEWGYSEAYVDQNMRATSGFGYVIHKPQIEGGDGPDDSEPGDTVYDFVKLLPSGKPGRGCVRFWELAW